MTVVVKFHGQASPSLVAWQQRLLARPPHDPRMAYIPIEEMIRWFEKYDGVPPGSAFQSEPTRRYVARYSADTWVHFKYKDTGRRTREVIVLGVTDSPPS